MRAEKRASVGRVHGIGYAGKLRSASWVLATVSVGCLGVAWGLVSEKGADGSSQPSSFGTVLLAAGVVTFAWSGPLTSLAGVDLFGSDRFRLYQPFRGGSRFSVLQALGWSLYAISSALLLMTLLNAHRPHVEISSRDVSGIGLLGFSANAMLNISLDSFVLDKDAADGPMDSEESGNKSVRRTSMGGSTFLSATCCLVSFLVFLLSTVVDFAGPIFDPGRAGEVLHLGTIVFSLCAATVHFGCGVLGETGRRGYSAFQPFSGGWEFILTSSIGWSFLGVMIYLSHYSTALGLHNVRGGLAVHGACGFVAITVLASSIDLFSTTPVVPDRLEVSLPAHDRKALYYASFVIEAVTTCSLVAIPENELGIQEWLGAAITACMIAGPPLAHVSGWLMLKDEGYFLFHPLVGGVSHVLAQAFGWLLYAIFIYSWLDLGKKVDQGAMRSLGVIGPLSVVSHALILASVRVFTPRGQPVANDASAKSCPPLRSRRPINSKTACGKGVFKTSDYLAAVSLATALTVDPILDPGWISLPAWLGNSSASRSENPLDLESRTKGAAFLLALSLVSWFISRLILYISWFGQGSIKQMLTQWRPFYGSEVFVMCEAVSWTLFAVGALADSILLKTFYYSGARRVGSYFGWTSAISLSHLFAHVILRYGVRILQKEKAQRAKAARRARSKERTSSRCRTGSIDSWDGEKDFVFRSSGVSPFVAVALAHLSFGLLVVADFRRIPSALWGAQRLLGSIDLQGPLPRNAFFHYAVLCAVIGVVTTQAWIGPRTLEGYRAIQPFRGGSSFVLLQSIGWTMFAVTLTLALVCYNTGLDNVAPGGVLSALGIGFYVSQLLLLWSQRRFNANAPPSSALDSRVGFVLGSLSLGLFVLTDIAVIRFGLSAGSVRVVTASAYVSACASLPLSALVYFKLGAGKDAPSGKTTFMPVLPALESLRSPLLVLAGCALWSFTFLLSGLLIAQSLVVTSDRLPTYWAATFTGASNLASHVIFGLAGLTTSGTGTTSPRSFAVAALTAIPVALISSIFLFAAVKFFVWLILPPLRGFLDYPMHYYAVVQKRVKGWLSPDGIQALYNVHLKRGIRYGPADINVMDMVRALDHSKTFQIRQPIQTCGSAPVIYCHGGGHICVTSEILLHSMTPFARAGMTVYSVEYPLSPDERYPCAVLSLLRAIVHVGKHHCSNPSCQPACVARRVTELFSHECDESCLKEGPDTSHGAACGRCGRALGTSTVKLIGDSAGGSLVSHAAALLSNPELMRKTIKLGGERFGDLLDLPPSSFPRVSKLAVLYGLLGRQTPIRNPATGSESRGAGNGRLWNLLCHVGISFIFALYDNETPQDPESAQMFPEPGSTLTDLARSDLKSYAEETLLICGEDDPLLQSNFAAERLLRECGHPVELRLFPGTHAFHGFPVNWMHYLGTDWRDNALPATNLLQRFLSDVDAFDEEAYERVRKSQTLIPDYTPMIVFPAFFFILPVLLTYCSIKVHSFLVL